MNPSFEPASPSFPPAPPPVFVGVDATLGFMDGRMKSYRLVKFAPQLSVLAIEGAPVKDALVQVDQVAWVGFVRRPASKPVRPRGELRQLRIHVPGGRCFHVEAAPDSDGGFYALPQDPETPFYLMFIYERGVHRREEKEPIGSMLVQQGLVGKDDVNRGIRAQRPSLGQVLVDQERMTPELVEAALAVQERKRLRLGEILVEAGLASQADIETALKEQRQRKGKKLGELLLEMGVLKEEDLILTLAKKFNLTFVDLDKCEISPLAQSEVPREMVERYGFLPVATDERSLTVVISDPLYTEVNDVLRFHLKRKRIIEWLARPSQLKSYISNYLSSIAPPPSRVSMPGMEQILKDLGTLEDDKEEEKDKILESDSGIIRLANQIIVDAYQRGVSDIHIEPNGRERNTTIRFRIDGDCVPYQEIPPQHRGALVSRFKIMASLDISEKRKPQDGKIRFRLGDQPIELRVATIPTVNSNEDVVMRILASSKPIPLDNMGMSVRNLKELKRLGVQPYGIILCVGPTGSGKTTTLHSLLGHINTVDMKIWTAEDPVEITQAGLRQVQVTPKTGLTFAAALRAFLRADPDVIMVGEMRDHETAAIAIEASLTGHLVLSTLHTNSAPETVNRLLDMGLDPFSFADALLGVLAQRLARRLCAACKEPYAPEPAELEEIVTAYGGASLLEKHLGVKVGPEFRLYRAPGCDACGKTGLKGRVGLHELLVSNQEMKEAIQKRLPAEQLRTVAMESGMTTLLQDGIAKAISGQTTLRQVLAVCSK